MNDLNPHAEQMADESMVRNLEAQARAVWPQEAKLLRRYELPARARILDAGCGTGEAAIRIADLFPQAHVLGVDIIDAHLDLARKRSARLGARVAFDHQSVFQLHVGDDAFDLTVCRHVIHSIPHAEHVLTELARVTRPGGYLHVVAEDYGMLHFQPGTLDPSEFWHAVPKRMSAAAGIDLYVGRNAYSIFRHLGLRDIMLDYVVVDTVRVPRETFAEILTAWRDGYQTVIAQQTQFSREDTVAYFDQMIRNVRDPLGYAVWFIPVVAARVPEVGERSPEPATSEG